MTVEKIRNGEQTRAEIGTQLRQHRLLSERNVSEVAAAAGMSQSKLSRLELGQLRQSETDIRKISEVLKIGTALTEQLVNQSLLPILRPERLLARRETLEICTQEDLLEEETRATTIAECAGVVLPGRTQTPDYAAAVYFKMHPDSRKPTLGDSSGPDEFLVRRLRRQASLFDRRKKFSILILETILHNKVVIDELMTEQYRRLIEIASMQNVDLSIVPCDVVLPALHFNDFQVLDDSLVTVETLTLRFFLRDADAIRAHVKTFESLHAIGVREQPAIDLLQRLISKNAVVDARGSISHI